MKVNWVLKRDWGTIGWKGKEEAIQGVCSKTGGWGVPYYSFQKSDRVWWKICEWRGVIGLEEWRNDYGGGRRQGSEGEKETDEGSKLKLVDKASFEHGW